MNKAEFNKVVQKMIAKHYLVNSNIENANKVINVFTESVVEALKDNDELLLVGFGRFTKRKVSARKGRNPKTGEIMDISSYFQIHFSVGKDLKEAVNTIETPPKKKKNKNS